jgi:hypothetical protein
MTGDVEAVAIDPKRRRLTDQKLQRSADLRDDTGKVGLGRKAVLDIRDGEAGAEHPGRELGVLLFRRACQ